MKSDGILKELRSVLLKNGQGFGRRDRDETTTPSDYKAFSLCLSLLLIWLRLQFICGHKIHSCGGFMTRALGVCRCRGMNVRESDSEVGPLQWSVLCVCVDIIRILLIDVMEHGWNKPEEQLHTFGLEKRGMLFSLM